MKKRLLLLVTIILLFSLSKVFARVNYFENNTLVSFDINRTSAEKIVKAISEQYLSKQYNTEYEQRNQDVFYIDSNNKLSDNTNNNYLSKTFLYRNLNMTPIDINKSNKNVFDCSSFITNVYLNGFGFDFRDYYDSYNKNHFYFNGKTIYTSLLENIQQQSNSIKKDTFDTSSTSKNLFVYFNQNGSGIKTSDINKIKENLQTGDILLIRRKSSSGSTSGHVMIYIKNHISFINNEATYTTGFIHSTGKDILNYDYEKGYSINSNLGIDKYSVRYTTFDRYVENNFKSKYENEEQIINYIAVIRPLNVILNDKYTNAYTDNEQKVTTKNIKILGLHSDQNISMQQYLYNVTQNEYITESNIVNDNDIISVKTYLKNKSNSKQKVTIKTNYINNDSMTYQTYGCKSIREDITINSCGEDQLINVVKNETDNTLTFTLEMNSGDRVYLYYKEQYNNGNNNNESIVVPGIRLYYEDTSDPIVFRDITFNGTNNSLTYNNTSKINITNKINTYYFNDNGKANRDKSLLRMYKEVFGLNLEQDFNNLDNSVNNTVESIILDLFEKKTSPNNNGLYYNKNTTLNKYVVKGMYGGTLVRGNEEKDRVNMLSFDLLEPGDIIVAYNPHQKFGYGNYMFVYGGYKYKDSQKNYIVYSKQKNVYAFVDKAQEVLKKAIVSEAFVVLRPTNYLVLDNNLLSFGNESNNKQYAVELVSNSEDVDDLNVEDDNVDIIRSENDYINTVLDENTDILDEDIKDDDGKSITYELDEDIKKQEQKPEMVDVDDTASYSNIVFAVLGVIAIFVGILLIKE